MKIKILKYLKIFLILVALHSFFVGLGLIFLPLEFLKFWGFEGYQGIFFKIQGGVFHIVMCGAYLPAAINPSRNRILILFAIFAKFTATLFLISYAWFIEMVWMVMASGFIDFLMAVILLFFYKRLQSELE